MVLMRATGLRIEQVTCIRPAWLVPALREIEAWRAGFLIQHMDRYGRVYEQAMPSPRNLAAHFKTAWDRAVKDRAVRPGIWNPGIEPRRARRTCCGRCTRSTTNDQP